MFDSTDGSKNYYSFRLKAGSPAINKGTNAGVLTDLDGKPRPVGLPDLGCFENNNILPIPPNNKFVALLITLLNRKK